MIPTIETIVEDLLAGKITKAQAVSWLHQHAEDAYRSLRDDFAAMALVHPFTQADDAHMRSEKTAEWAYALADAMIAEREK